MGRARNTRWRIKEFGQYLLANTERQNHLHDVGKVKLTQATQGLDGE
jgi:hypothetical protein